MQVQVVAIETGTEYSDKRRRVTLKLIRVVGPGGTTGDFGYDRFRMSERELGIVGLKLDDVIEVAFGCDAVAIREQRKAAGTVQS